MNLTDILKETYEVLWSNRARSGLTVLGIVIGISSVIAMVAIGQGAQGAIQDRIESIGSNLVLVTPGAQRGVGVSVSAGRGSAQSLTQEDADAIAAEVIGIQAVAPELTGRYQVTSKGKNTNTQVIGTVAAYPTVRNVEIEEGSFLTDSQVRSLSKVAVIGPTTRDDLFGSSTSAIGQVIRIKQIEFRVIGVTKAKGGSGFGNPDDVLYVPLTSAQRFLAGDTYLSTVSVQATDADSMTDIQAQITQLLLTRHHIADAAFADFSVQNQADILETASSITDTLTIFLGAVAGISLLVGGIGIMNMMLTTVTERTREIGLRKAIGATSGDISRQFLVEAVMLTFTGGVLGVALGWFIAFGFTYLNIIQASITLTSVLLAFGVAAFIGIVFGYYPARRAAKLNPIEALRYE